MPSPPRTPAPGKAPGSSPGKSPSGKKRSASPRFRAAEFFAGIGLVRLALEKTGDWRVVYANDIDPDKKKMYADNFGDDHFHFGRDQIMATTLASNSCPTNSATMLRWHSSWHRS